MCAGAPIPSPDPISPRILAPSDPVAMPTPPPPAPPAVAEDEERPCPQVLLSPRPMFAGAPPSSLDPCSSRVVAPPASVAIAIAMPSPPLAPPAAAAAEEKRPSPRLKMKLLFPFAVNCVFGGIGRTWGMALVGLHFSICVVKVVSFTTYAEEARFLTPIFHVWVYLGIAAMLLMTCVDMVYYMVKLLLPYAVSCLFSGMGRPWGMAMIGLHIVLCIVKVLSFTTAPELAHFWMPIFRVWVYFGLAMMVLMTCLDIGYYLYGLYALKFDPPQQQLEAAAAVVQLPPPPPQMDMC